MQKNSAELVKLEERVVGKSCKMKLSICIPTFNRVEQLREILTCLLPQLEEGMEVVISDNASADETESMVATYMSQYSCITYHRWPKNMGADRNYLKVVEQAHGEYCWLFGSDDLVEPGCVREVLKMLSDGCDIYLFNRMEWHENRARVRPRFWLIPTTPCKVFAFSSPDAISEYLGLATSVGAIFSYLSSIVVRRGAWLSVPYDDRYTGTAYSHAAILLSMINGGCRLHYDPRQLVKCKMGDDSFAKNGTFKRITLDLDGYGMIRDEVFYSRPYAQLAINRILCVEYKWWQLASSMLSLSDEEWRIVRGKLNKIGYPRKLLLYADILGGYKWIIQLLRLLYKVWMITLDMQELFFAWLRRCVARRGPAADKRVTVDATTHT